MTTGLVVVQALIFVSAILSAYMMLTPKSGAWGPCAIIFVVILILYTNDQVEDALRTMLPGISLFRKVGVVADGILAALGGLIGNLWWWYNAHHQLGFFWRILWWADLLRRDIGWMSTGAGMHYSDHDESWWGYKYRNKK